MQRGVLSSLTLATCAMMLSGATLTLCQAAADQPPPVPDPLVTPKNAGAATCVQPAPLPGLAEHDGPLKKTVSVFARSLERRTALQPHYKPGAALCTLTLDDKFLLFLNGTLDPAHFIESGFNAGIDHLSGRDPTFGQGAAGYGKRFGASLLDATSSRFFKDFAYPAIFSEDPRYYPMGRGSGYRRLRHAAQHLFVGRHEDGRPMFNYSQWLGTITAAELSNFYHPGNRPGTGETARRVGYSFAFDIGFDVLREFLPEITQKLMIPLRGNTTRNPSGTGHERQK